MMLDLGYSEGPYPLVCTNTSNVNVCLKIENGTLTAMYGNESVSYTSLSENVWYNIIYRYSLEGKSEYPYNEICNYGSLCPKGLKSIFKL